MGHLSLNDGPKVFPRALLLSVLVIVAIAYWPGLSGPFMFDDDANILKNDAIHISELTFLGLFDAMVSGGAGPTMRPLTMLTFALNHRLTGLDSFQFKLTNLLIHLTNGVLVFAFVQRLLGITNSAWRHTRAPWIALTTATMWVAHPAQLTSVLYVVQRMASLSATFVLLGLWFYVRARAAMLVGRNPWITVWLLVPLCALAAALAKENGVLLIPFVFVIEVTLLRFRVGGIGFGSIQQFYFVFLVIPCAVAAIYLLMHPAWITAAEAWRPFTVTERLMTESRVLWLYLKILILPATHDLALYYDDLPISHGWLDPPSTLVSIFALVAVTAYALKARARFPWLTFGVLWFLVAHSIESSFIMLELVHAHRNYVAYLGPILALCMGLSRSLGAIEPRMPAIVASIAFLFALVISWQRATQWANPVDLMAFEVRHRPMSARANYDLGRLYFAAEGGLKDTNFRRLAVKQFWRTAELNPRGVNAVIALIQISSKNEQQVDPKIMSTLTARLQRYPLVPGDIAAFRQLIACNADGGCTTPLEQLLAIFGAALANPQLARGTKAEILMVMAPFYANKLGDLPACLELIREAIGLAPNNPSFRLVLAGAHVANKDPRSALEQLRIAKSLNRMGKFNREIRAVEKRIAAFVEVNPRSGTAN
jgi:protein O-mannosyl-transferase